MAKASLFRNNRSQAVRLPKALEFPESVKSVEIVKAGKGLLILPSDSLWDHFFEGPGATPDFMEERAQPALQERDFEG